MREVLVRSAWRRGCVILNSARLPGEHLLLGAKIACWETSWDSELGTQHGTSYPSLAELVVKA